MKVNRGSRCSVPCGNVDEIRVPLAKMNEHVTVARRSGSDWWVGSLNNGAERNLNWNWTSLVRETTKQRSIPMQRMWTGIQTIWTDRYGKLQGRISLN